MYSIEEEEYDLLSDSKYRMYTSYIDKALKNFEYSSEWADLISAISKIKKIIASYGQYSESIPKLSIIAKRLGQCLHPGLPSGVHLKCLETYELIFSQIKPEILSENLFIFASGLFPVMSYAALNVKSYLLGIYERYFLNLQKSLQQAFPGLLVGLLGGLEEGSQHNKRVLELIEKFCNCVGKRFFYDKLWLCVSNNASIRYNALLYVLAHYNRRLSMDDQIDIMGYYMHNFVSSICYCFSDSNILAQRNAIEFVMNAIPIHSHILLHSDMTKLMASAIKILLRRDISLNRRIFSWFLANSRSEKTSDQTNYFVHNSRDMLVDALTEHMHSCYTLFDLIYERNLGVDEFKKIENQNDFNNSILKCVQLDPKMIDKTLVAFRILSVLINNTIIKDNIMHFMFLRLLEFTFDWVYLNSLFHIDSRCLTFNKLYYKHKYISVETTHSGDWNSSNDSLELNYKENILSEHYKNGRKYISFNKNFQELIDEDGRLKSNSNMTLVCLYCDVWSIDEYKYEFERKDLNGLIRTKKYKTFDEFLIKSNDVSKVLINNFKLILTSVQPKSMIDILINRFNIIMEGLNSCIVSDDEMSFTSSNTINSFSVQHCDDKELVSYLQLNRYCNAIRFLIRMVIQENESNISDNLLCYYMKHTLVMANKCIDKLVVTNIVNLNFLWIAILQKIDCKMDDCNITSSSSLMQFRNLYIKFARNVLSSILKVDANKTRTITQLINQFTGTCYSGEYINDPVTYDVRMVLGTITTLLFDVIFRFFNDDTYINNDDEKGEIIVQEIAKLWTLFLTVSIVHTNPIVYIWSIETLLDFGKFLYNERRDKCLPEKIITLIKDEFDVIFDTNYFSTILKRLWDLLGNTNDVNIVLTIYNVDSINNFKLMDTIILNHLKSELFEDRIQACQIFVNFWNIFLQISEYNENLNIIFITQSIQYMVNILSDVDDVCFSVVESWVLECFRENKISFIIDNLLLVLLNDSTKRYSIFCEEGSEQFKKCFLVDVTKSHLENKSKCQNVEKPFNKDDNEMEKNPIESKIDTPIINTSLAEPENETSPDNIVDMFEFKTFDAYLQNINSIDSGFSEMFFSAPIKKRYLSYLNLDRVACMYNHLLFYYKTPELQNLSKSLKCLESFFDLDAILIVNKFATCPFFDLSEGSTKVLCPILESMISHKCSIILSIFKDISKYSIPLSNTIDSDKITSLNNHICSNLTKLNTHMNYLDILLQTLINFLRSFPREKNLNGFTYENEQFKVRICKILLKIFQGMFTLISNNDNFYPQYYYDILTRNDTQKLLISVYGFYLFQLTNILKNDYKSSNSCILNCKTILKYLVFMFNIFIKIEHYYFNNNPCDEASSEKSGDSKKDISAGVGESLSSYLDCPNMSCLYVIVPIITSKIFVASLLRTFEYFELFSLQVCILDTIIDCLPYFNKQLGSLCTTFLVCIFKNINNHVSKLDEKKIWIISILLKYVKSIFNFFMTESVKFNGNDFQMKNIISYKNYITKFNILKCKETKKVHIINARKQVFKILPSIIFSLVNLWNIYNTNLFKEIQKCQITKRSILSNIGSIIEVILYHDSITCITAFSVVWGELSIGKRINSPIEYIIPSITKEQEMIITFLQSLECFPCNKFFVAIKDGIKNPLKGLYSSTTSHLNKTYINKVQTRKTSLDICMLRMFYYYICKLDTGLFINHWSVLYKFYKDSSNDLEKPTCIFVLMYSFVDISERMKVSDSNMYKELQEITIKLIEKINTIISALLENTTWIRRSLIVKNSVQVDYNEYPEDMKKIPKNRENYRMRYSVQGIMALVDSLSKLMDIVFTSEDKEKTVPILTSVLTNVFPFLRARSCSNIPAFRASSNLLRNLSDYQFSRKVWKRDIFELFNDSSFFQVDETSFKDWVIIIDNLMSNDTTTFRELLTRPLSSQKAALPLFISREQEIEQRCAHIKRISFVIYSGEIDQYYKYLPEIQEKITENLKFVSPFILNEIFFCFRIILLKFSRNLVSIWPIIIYELTNALSIMHQFLRAKYDDDDSLRQRTNSIMKISGIDLNAKAWKYAFLGAVKLLNLLIDIPVTHLPHFQFYNWAFVDLNQQYNESTESPGVSDIDYFTDETVNTKENKKYFIPYTLKINQLLQKSKNNTKDLVSKKLNYAKLVESFIPRVSIKSIEELSPFFENISDRITRIKPNDEYQIYENINISTYLKPHEFLEPFN